MRTDQFDREFVPAPLPAAMDSAAVQASPLWQRGLQEAIDKLRREHPDMGVKKLIAELKKNETYACASSKLVRIAMAASDSRDAAKGDPLPEAEVEGGPPAPQKAVVENRAARRARMKQAEKAAKKKSKAKQQLGGGKPGDTLSKGDMRRLQSDYSSAFTNVDAEAVAKPLKETDDGKEMRARLAKYQEDEMKMGLLSPDSVLLLKTYYKERSDHYAALKKKLERKWTLNSAIIHERVSNVDDDKYEAAARNCERLMKDKEDYDASITALVFCREAFLRSPSKIALERHISKTFHFQDVNQKLSAAERKEAAR